MQQAVSDKAHIDEAIITAVQQHELELEQQFAGDVKHVKLKEQLSQFARMNELDEALIALWEEIEHYPTRSGEVDFDNWNKLNLTGIGGSSEEDTNSVEFMRGGVYARRSSLQSDGADLEWDERPEFRPLVL